MLTGMRWWVALLVLSLAGCAAGCAAASGAPAVPAPAAFAPCPRAVQAPGYYSHPGSVRAAVPRGPVAAQLCVYRGAKAGPAQLAETAVLSASRARTVALLIDTRAGSGSSCDAGSPVLLRLRYPGGTTFSGLAAGCSPEVLATGGRLEVLAPEASLALGGLLPAPPGGRTVRVPDYLGRRLAQVRPTPLSLYELTDPSVPFGQVVWQTPLPGTRQGAAGGVQLVLGVHPAPPCRASQLAGRYTGTGAGAGSYIGGIALADSSAQPCTLTGRLTLTGLRASGEADTATASERLRPGLVLSPGAGPRLTPPALIAVLGFAGPNDDATQTCFHHETVPAAFSITLGTGGTVRVLNRAVATGGPFRTCHGGLSFASAAGPSLL